MQKAHLRVRAYFLNQKIRQLYGMYCIVIWHNKRPLCLKERLTDILYVQEVNFHSNTYYIRMDSLDNLCICKCVLYLELVQGPGIVLRPLPKLLQRDSNHSAFHYSFIFRVPLLPSPSKLCATGTLSLI